MSTESHSGTRRLDGAGTRTPDGQEMTMPGGPEKKVKRRGHQLQLQMEANRDAMKVALGLIGGPVALAAIIKTESRRLDLKPITSQRISGWQTVPESYVPLVEYLSGVSREELRADVDWSTSRAPSGPFVTKSTQIEKLPNVHIQKGSVVPQSKNGASGDERANAPTSPQLAGGSGGNAAIPQVSNTLPDGPGQAVVEFSVGDQVTELGVLNTWNIPAVAIAPRLKDPNGKTIIMEIVGEEMSPTLDPHEYIIVDTSDPYPSPTGVFVLHNNVTTEIRRLLLTGGDPQHPRVKVIFDNPKYEKQGYECLLSDLKIIGRVKVGMYYL